MHSYKYQLEFIDNFSCEAFHLTQPFKTSAIPLTVETTNRSLENLVQQIRRNVLQIHHHNTFNTIYQNEKRLSEAISESASCDGILRSSGSIRYPSPRGSTFKKMSEHAVNTKDSTECSTFSETENPIYSRYYRDSSKSSSLMSSLQLASSADLTETGLNNRNLFEVTDIRILATLIR